MNATTWINIFQKSGSESPDPIRKNTSTNKCLSILLVTCIFIMINGCNGVQIKKDIEKTQDSLNCRIVWVHDRYFENDSLQKLIGYYGRKISVIFEICNTTTDPAFVPMFSDIDKTGARSTIIAKMDGKEISHINSIFYKPGKYANMTLQPNDTIRLEMWLSGFDKSSEEGGNIKDIIQKINFEYKIDSTDTNISNIMISPLKIDKGDIKYIYRSEQSIDLDICF